MAAATAPRIAVVTGASSGIGRAIALALSRAGYDLHLIGRDRDRLDAVVDEVHGDCRACAHVADLADDLDCLTLRDRLTGDVDELDLLVHSAGAIVQGPCATVQVTDLDRQYRVNLRAPFVLTQGLIGALRKRRGQIVFINSTAGTWMNGPSRSGVYAATKQALRVLADGLRVELNPLGIRVLSVYPGKTASRMQAMLHASDGQRYDPSALIQPDDIATAVLGAIDLPRSAELTDLTIVPMARASAEAGLAAESNDRAVADPPVGHRKPTASAAESGGSASRIRCAADGPRTSREHLRS